MPAQPPQPPERPDQDSDLVFVDDAEEARKPKPPRPSQRAAPQRPPSERTRPPGAGSQRAGHQPKRRPSGQHRRPSGRHKRPPSGQHKRPERPETRRVDRPTHRRPGKGSQSVRLPAPTFERVGPDPHLRVGGATSGRPFCLVSAVLEAPILLSREKRTVIGRGEGVEVRVRSHMVSREHAEILWDDDGFYVRDLGSTNGSLVNGYLLRDRVPLRDGDVVYVGNFEIQVKVLRPGEDPEEHLQGMTRPFRPPPKDKG